MNNEINFAPIWNELHKQTRQIICNYACVVESFAEQNWGELPELAKRSIVGWFEAGPLSEAVKGVKDND